MKLVYLLLALSFVLGACTKKKFNIQNRSTSAQNGDQAAGEVSPEVKKKMESSTIVWKRYRAFESGVTGALGLTVDQMCVEVGEHSCIDKVHLTVLGGNEPLENGQYERADAPSVLTAFAVDRVILSACKQRLDMDKAGSPQVFKHFPLTGGSANEDQLKGQATELYQRFLARDPSAEELDVVAKFVAEAGSGEQAALSLCFAIGTHSENIFL